jgi:hypothetical protein
MTQNLVEVGSAGAQPGNPVEALGFKILDELLVGERVVVALEAVGFVMAHLILNGTNAPKTAARAMGDCVITTVDELLDEGGAPS